MHLTERLLGLNGSICHGHILAALKTRPDLGVQMGRIKAVTNDHVGIEARQRLEHVRVIVNIAAVNGADTLPQKHVIKSQRRQVPQPIRLTPAKKDNLQLNARRRSNQIENRNTVGRRFVND